MPFRNIFSRARKPGNGSQSAIPRSSLVVQRGIGPDSGFARDGKAEPRSLDGKETSHLASRVRIDHFSIPSDANDGVKEAEKELVVAITALDKVLQKITETGKDYIPKTRAILNQKKLKLSSFKSRLEMADRSFLDVVAKIQEHQEGRDEMILGKTTVWLKRLLPLFQLSANIVKDVAAAVGDLHVRLPAIALCAVFELAAKHSERAELVVGGLKNIAADEGFLRELRDFPTGHVELRILESAIKLQTALVEFLRHSLLWLDKSTLLRVVETAIGQEGVEKASDTLAAARADIKAALATEDYLRSKRREMQHEEAKLLCNLVSDVDHESHNNRQGELRVSRLPDTAEWILDDSKFLKWRDGAITTIWCEGPPGAGKSYVSSRIVDHLLSRNRDPKVRVVYLYCKRQDYGTQDIHRVFGAILRQMLAFTSGPAMAYKDQLEFRHETLERRIKLATAIAAEFERIYIVLDGLDEFSANPDDLVDVMSKLAYLRNKVTESRSGSLSICVSCRKGYDRPKEELQPGGTIPIKAPATDIRIMVDELLNKRSARHFLTRHSDMRELIVEAIVDSSDCIFQLAKLQTESVVRRMPDGRPVVEKQLKDLNPKVDHYYHEIIQHIKESAENQAGVLSLLGWLAFSAAPLHTEELSVALAIDAMTADDRNSGENTGVDVEHYVALTQGLVYIESVHDAWAREDPLGAYGSDSSIADTSAQHQKPPPRRVSLAHETILEYLKRDDGEITSFNSARILETCWYTLAYHAEPALVQALMYCRRTPTYYSVIRSHDGSLMAFREALVWSGLLERYAKMDEVMSLLRTKAFWWILWAHNHWVEHVPTSSTRHSIDLEGAQRALTHFLSICDPDLPQPQHYCASKGYLEPLKWTLKHGADPTASYRKSGPVQRVTLRLDALQHGQAATFTHLVESCPESEGDETAEQLMGELLSLPWTLGAALPELLQSVLALGVDPNGMINGNSFVHEAIRLDENELASLLLAHPQVDVNDTRCENRRPAFLCLLARGTRPRYGQDPDDLHAILRRGSLELGRSDTQGRTALMYAFARGASDLGGAMIARDHGIINAKDNRGNTVLHYASDAWMIQLVTDGDSVDINAQQADGRTALSLASAQYLPSVSDIQELPYMDPLIDCVAEVSKKNIGCSCTQGAVEVVSQLIHSSELDLNCCDNAGHSALDYAFAFRHFLSTSMGSWEGVRNVDDEHNSNDRHSRDEAVRLIPGDSYRFFGATSIDHPLTAHKPALLRLLNTTQRIIDMLRDNGAEVRRPLVRILRVEPPRDTAGLSSTETLEGHEAYDKILSILDHLTGKAATVKTNGSQKSSVY